MDKKYENINIFFPFCKNIWDVKACGACLSQGNLVLMFLFLFFYFLLKKKKVQGKQKWLVSP